MSSAEINVFDLLKQAWNKALQKRYLWFLGFWVAASNSLSFNRSDYSLSELEDSTLLGSAKEFFQANFGLLLLIVGIVFTLLLLVMFLRILAQVSMLKALQNPALAAQLGIRQRLALGKQFFWPFFKLNLLLTVFILLILLVLSLPLFLLLSQKILSGAIIFGLLALVIFIPSVFLLSWSLHYARYYLVLGGQKPLAALNAGYFLLKKKLVPTLWAWLAAFLGNLLFSLALLILTGILAACFFFPFLLGYFPAHKIASLSWATLGIFSIISILIVGRAILGAWLEIFWYDFFCQLTALPLEKNLAQEKTTETIPQPEIATS